MYQVLLLLLVEHETSMGSVVQFNDAPLSDVAFELVNLFSTVCPSVVVPEPKQLGVCGVIQMGDFGASS
jgi:hypothetical protein